MCAKKGTLTYQYSLELQFIGKVEKHEGKKE